MAKIGLRCCMVVIICMAGMAECFEFRVGGPRGWIVPTSDETYNQWASRNRFLIGDSLHFKYINDSVVVVNSEDYNNCNATAPISTYEDGETIFTFDRYGFFYFISGNFDHCMDGQKLIVQVMAMYEKISPATGPSSASGGPSGGQPSGSGGTSGSQPSGSSASPRTAGVAPLYLVVILMGILSLISTQAI